MSENVTWLPITGLSDERLDAVLTAAYNQGYRWQVPWPDCCGRVLRTFGDDRALIFQTVAVGAEVVGKHLMHSDVKHCEDTYGESLKLGVDLTFSAIITARLLNVGVQKEVIVNGHTYVLKGAQK